jgi:hypothetical protein
MTGPDPGGFSPDLVGQHRDQIAAAMYRDPLLGEVERLRAAVAAVHDICDRLDEGGLADVCADGHDLPTVLRRALAVAS